MQAVLRILADDLTGACDVAAALLPWPGGIVVAPALGQPCPPTEMPLVDATVVRNTHSRTLPPTAAAATVRQALADVPHGWCGILLKKIDTGLRGAFGAELDAAMDALAIDEAIVVPAIPEVGRTTEQGIQLIAGVPVDQTAFAHDPQNPVREARVTAVIEATSCRRAGLVDLATVRRPGGVEPAIVALRQDGVQIVVCDAQTDEDLAIVVRAVMARPRPVLLAGSIGVARALRQGLAIEPGRGVTVSSAKTAGRGTLVVVGSAHPMAQTQVDFAVASGDLDGGTQVVLGHADDGEMAARALRAGRSTALLPPARQRQGDSAAVLAAIRRAAVAALERTCPAGLVLIGGETAFEVLAGLGHPWLWMETRPFPLVVRSRLVGGTLDGLPLVTKGGSSGEVSLLAQILRPEVRR